jgi:hypothetical protein
VTTSHLAAQHLPQTAHPDEFLIVSSKDAKRCALVVDPEVSAQSMDISLHQLIFAATFSDIADVFHASIKGRWEFGSKHGALLILVGPRISSIPANSLLKLLVGVPALKDKSLVTQVISCHAYSLYLSTSSECPNQTDFRGMMLTHCYSQWHDRCSIVGDRTY